MVVASLNYDFVELCYVFAKIIWGFHSSNFFNFAFNLVGEVRPVCFSTASSSSSLFFAVSVASGVGIHMILQLSLPGGA